MKQKTYTSSSRRLAGRRKAWLGKLADLGPVVRGSLVTAQRGNHVAHQLTVSIKSKTHTVYVPVDMVQEVKEWIKNYQRLQRIIKEVSKLSMAIIHRRVPENRGGGRSPRPQSRSR